MSPPPSQFYFFLRSIRHPKRWTNVLPPRRHHPSVGCCVEQSSSGHPRPMLRPSCNFSMGAISAPQTRGQNAARARLDAGRLHQAHGEPRRCDLDPWRVYPWRGRAKPLGGRVTAAHLVSCAFLCEFCSVWRADILHTCLVLSIWGAGCPLIPEKCYIVGNKGTTVHFYVRDFSLRGTNWSVPKIKFVFVRHLKIAKLVANTLKSR